MESGDKRECCCSAAFIIVFIMVLKWGWDLDFISMIFAGLLYLMIATPVYSYCLIISSIVIQKTIIQNLLKI